ncbi:tetratricopeptide repeat protein [Thermodesulfobacteriota bacterium]
MDCTSFQKVFAEILLEEDPASLPKEAEEHLRSCKNCLDIVAAHENFYYRFQDENFKALFQLKSELSPASFQELCKAYDAVERFNPDLQTEFMDSVNKTLDPALKGGYPTTWILAKNVTEAVNNEDHDSLIKALDVPSTEFQVSFQKDLKWIAFEDSHPPEEIPNIGIYGDIKSRDEAYNAVEELWEKKPNDIFHMRVLHRLHYFDRAADEFKEKAKLIIDSMTRDQKDKLVYDLEGWIYNLASREEEIYPDGFLDCMTGLLLDQSKITAALGYWHFVLGNHEKALEYLEIYPEVEPSEPETNIAIAIAYFDLGQKDMFEKYINIAEKVVKDDAEWLELVMDIKREAIKKNIYKAMNKLKYRFKEFDPSMCVPLEIKKLMPSSV